MDKKYNRWALVFRPPYDFGFLLGKFFWPDANEDEIPTRTFRTRKLARAALKELSTSKFTHVVKVTVTIKEEK